MFSLCSRAAERTSHFSIERVLATGFMHIESWELITNQSPEEKRIEVKKRFQETAEQLYKDLDKVAELRDALYA